MQTKTTRPSYPPLAAKRVIAIHKPNVSALLPEERTLLKTAINNKLEELLQEISVTQEEKKLSIEEADTFSMKTANLIVETALQTRCRRTDEKRRSRYITRLNERLHTIKETCDTIKQLKTNQFSDRIEEIECLAELRILMSRLCLCDIPNLPIQINRETIQT